MYLLQIQFERFGGKSDTFQVDGKNGSGRRYKRMKKINKKKKREKTL